MTEPQFRYIGHAIHPNVECPEMASLIGRFSVSFSHMENEFSRIFASLLGIDDKTISDILFDQFRSATTRYSMMLSLAEKAIISKNADQDRAAFISEYKRCLAEYRAITSLRNGYIHGLWWTVWDNYPGGRIVATIWANIGVGENSFLQSKPVTPSTLKTLISRTSKLREDVRTLTDMRLRSFLGLSLSRPS